MKRPVHPDRDRQDTPAEIVSLLMAAVQAKFYQGNRKQFFQHQNFLRRNVILWPARWLNEKAVTLPPERYKKILLDLFVEIAVHGQTETVKYWPGYLMHCVQQHFAIHGEEYYEEGKSIRSALEKATMAISRAKDGPGRVDPIRVMAEAQSLAKAPKRRPGKAPVTQLNLGL